MKLCTYLAKSGHHNPDKINFKEHLVNNNFIMIQKNMVHSYYQVTSNQKYNAHLCIFSMSIYNVIIIILQITDSFSD